jgi:hypothetical protein
VAIAFQNILKKSHSDVFRPRKKLVRFDIFNLSYVTIYVIYWHLSQQKVRRYLKFLMLLMLTFGLQITYQKLCKKLFFCITALLGEVRQKEDFLVRQRQDFSVHIHQIVNFIYFWISLFFNHFLLQNLFLMLNCCCITFILNFCI